MNSSLTTEEKILTSARKIFLQYGFHGTTLQNIAIEAKINKTTIHYYFRTKKILYKCVIQYVADIIIEKNILKSSNYHILLFTINEMNNNRTLFIDSLNNYTENNWVFTVNKYIITELKNISINEFSNFINGIK